MVQDLRGAFREAKKFNQAINAWSVGNIKSLKLTFAGADTFSQPMVWDTKSVTSLDRTFDGATDSNSFRIGAFNGDIGTWQTSKVKTAEHLCRKTQFN